jgi:hypothetical protein
MSIEVNEIRKIEQNAFGKYVYYIGFEVLTAVVMKTPRSPLTVNRCFSGACRLHLQGRRTSQARNQRESKQSHLATCFHAGFLLGLFFDPDDGGDMLR